MYIAHTRNDGGEQLLRDHLKQVAERASDTLKPANLQSVGYLAGILHDLGKYSGAWQEYIRSGGRKNNAVVIHSFQGVKYVLDRWHNGDAYRKMTAEVVAYAIAAHHGMIDIYSADENGFDHRRNAGGLHYIECVENLYADCIPMQELDNLFEKAVQEFSVAYNVILATAPVAEKKKVGIAFASSCIIRLVTSAVMQGDKTDSADFEGGKETEMCDADWEKALSRIEEKISAFPMDTDIARARRYISDECRKKADDGMPRMRLYTPTGGGKTISSLRYAVAHAKAHSKRRAVLTIPLLSILEQNADVVREYAGKEIVLEHHSNVVQERVLETMDGFDDSDYRYLTDSWDFPIVVTTMAQFFNTLFKSSSSSVRRFSALLDSVIVMDEVQTVPFKTLGIYTMMVNFLTNVCRSTIVFCSATQPPFEKLDCPYKVTGGIGDMVVYKDGILPVFDRTRILYDGEKKFSAIPEYVNRKFAAVNSLLVVCNTRTEAKKLFKEMDNGLYKCYSLSSDMCVAHRRDVISGMTAALANGERVLCVSTQVIEAGVDVSFECVIRFLAGLDNIVQAAGRCNRNAEKNGLADVFVVSVEDEVLSGRGYVIPNDIMTAKNAMVSTFKSVMSRKDEVSIALDFSGKKIDEYYANLYSRSGITTGGNILYPIDNTDKRSGNNLFGKCSITNSNGYLLAPALKSAGQKFTVYDNDGFTLVVPYKGGKEICDEISRIAPLANNEEVWYNYRHRLKELVDMAKPYTCTIQTEETEKNKFPFTRVEIGKNGVIYLFNGNYDGKTGVDRTQSSGLFL